MKRYCNLAVIFLAISLIVVGCSRHKKTTQSESQQISQTNETWIAAQNGNAEAQNMIGNFYYKGFGVAQNFTEAIKWYEKSANQGFPLAQYNLGWMNQNGEGVPQDYQAALKWYQKAAEQGDADSQQKIGFFYSNGIGVTKDNMEALKWYRLAAEQGNVSAQNNIGYCYGSGVGVAQNEEAAFKWYWKAAQQGMVMSEFCVGEHYRTGVGVEQDNVEAYKWYFLAAKQNDDDGYNKQAADALGQLAKQLTQSQIKDAQQRANAFVSVKPKPEPPTECTESFLLADESKSFVIQIHRILVGQRVVDENLFSQFQLDEFHKQKKEIIYFEASVANAAGPQEAAINPQDFTLEDSHNSSYSSELTSDYIHGQIQWGKTCRGGFAFAVSYGKTPQKLVFDTGLVTQIGGIKYYATFDSLDKLKVFGEPVSER